MKEVKTAHASCDHGSDASIYILGGPVTADLVRAMECKGATVEERDMYLIGTVMRGVVTYEMFLNRHGDADYYLCREGVIVTEWNGNPLDHEQYWNGLKKALNA